MLKNMTATLMLGLTVFFGSLGAAYLLHRAASENAVTVEIGEWDVPVLPGTQMYSGAYIVYVLYYGSSPISYGSIDEAECLATLEDMTFQVPRPELLRCEKWTINRESV